MHMVRLLRYFSFILPFIGHVTCYLSDVHGQVASGGVMDGAGIRVSANRRGIEALNDLVGRVISDVICKAKLPDVTKTPLPLSSVAISNLKLRRFAPTQKYLLEFSSPNKVTWRARKVALEIFGDLKTSFMFVSDSGSFSADMADVDAQVDLSVVNRGGYPQFTAHSCHFRINDMDLHIPHFTSSVVQTFVNANSRMISGFLKPIVEDEVCSLLKDILSEELNAEIRTYDLKSSLVERYSKRRANNRKLFNGLMQSPTDTIRSYAGDTLAKNLHAILTNSILDFSLVNQPVLRPSEGTMEVRGEVSWKGKGQTPFGPNPLGYYSYCTTQSRQFCLALSDYVLNSALYHAYKQQKIRLSLGAKEVPLFKHFFRTSCRGHENMCIGSFFPDLEYYYPNHDLAFEAHATQAPAIIFNNDGLTAHLTAEIKVCAIETVYQRSKITLAQIGITAQASSRLHVSHGNVIVGNLTINRLDARLKAQQKKLRSFDQTKIDGLARMASVLVQSLANAVLSKGLELPRLSLGSIVNPKLEFGKRKLVVETDFQLDNSALSRMVQKIVSRNSRRFISG